MNQKITLEEIQRLIALLDQDDNWTERLGNLSDYLDDSRKYIKHLLNQVQALTRIKDSAKDFAQICKNRYLAVPGEYDTLMDLINEVER